MYREILPEEVRLDKTLGYEYFTDKNHPLATKSPHRVYYHRHVASIMVGRWLSSTEVVHHIDGNKRNNSPKNLEVLSTKEHSKLHQELLGKVSVELTCAVCAAKFTSPKSQAHYRFTCSAICAGKRQTKWNISKEDLELLIWHKSYTDIAKEYPISDVGAKKRAKALKCKLPPPYFFSKTEDYRKEQRKLNGIPDLST